MSRALRIGLVYETFETYPRRPDEPADAHAEYEPESTIDVLAQAVSRLGHEAVRLGAPHALLARMASDARREALGIDAALCIAEGYGSRNRESWAPVLLEMAGVPCLGSDALSLSTSLDKLWARRAVAAAGVPVPAGACLASAAEARSAELPAPFPLFVKPRWEGTAKGIRASSRVEDRDALAREVARVVRDYEQPALVEAFVPGAEYTVGVVGNDPPRALPALQRALARGSGIGLHALADAVAHDLPGELTPALERELAALALRAYAALECLDFARVDLRLDAAGRPLFLEINPLPTFAIDGTFAIAAELEGRAFPDWLADVIAAGLARLGLAPAAGRAGRRAS